jgi:hypothetical protein
MADFPEKDVHEFMYKQGLEALVDDSPEIDAPPSSARPLAPDEEEFELWRVIKARVMEKIRRLHRTIRFIAANRGYARASVYFDNTRCSGRD